MITRVEFTRFRGFEYLQTDLSPHAYIVGPNSAGKSTILEAVAMAEQCLQQARRKRPPLKVWHRSREWGAYPLSRNHEDGEDPVRFDFGSEESRVSICWGDDALIEMVWPETSEDNLGSGFFYLQLADGKQPSVAATRVKFPPITVIPVVSPFDRVEELKDDKYVRSQVQTRRASRHFRNHAFQMKQRGEWDAFKEFVAPWLPELDLQDVQINFSPGHSRLTVYYAEPGSRVPKELAWAGDGFQIWIQLLWHLFRSEAAGTVVLDEPDVYLHPDLQRRLVRMLTTVDAQVILASHSEAVVAEAPEGGVLWVNRRENLARRISAKSSPSPETVPL